jgi:hypothetical protein
MVVQDGPVRFLLDHTGDLDYGRGFEMLAILEAHLCPDTFSHAFATLISLITNKQDEECIHEFQACFEGHLDDISWSMVSIPLILQVVLFLQALYPCYKAIINLFTSKQKEISIAMIHSIISDAKYMDELAFLGTLMANLGFVWTASIVVSPGHHPTRPVQASATSLASTTSSPLLPMAQTFTWTAMCLPCEAPPLDAPGVVQGSGGHHTHKQVGAMAVALQAAQAALPGGRMGARWPSTASDEVLPCAGPVDDGFVAELPTWCGGGATLPRPRPL